MTDEEAQELSDMLARVMGNFVNKPHQLVEELDLSKAQSEETVLQLSKEKAPTEVPAEAAGMYRLFLMSISSETFWKCFSLLLNWISTYD